MKSRKELIEELEQNSYFLIFGTRSQFEHKQEIQKKCLAYWHRRFNRVLVKLAYKL